MSRNTVPLILILFFMFNKSSGQSMGRNYQTALGVKFYPSSLSLKHFVNKNHAVEGLGYFWEYGTRITGLYEIHHDIAGAPGLKWYIGPGAHIGFWNTKWKDRYARNSGAYFGVDGVLGLDYKINKAPINLSIDWQPSFTLGSTEYSGYGFEGGWGGFAIRYTF